MTGFRPLLPNSVIPATITRIQDKCRNPNSFVGIWVGRNLPESLESGRSGQIRQACRNPAVLARSGQPVRILQFWPADRNPTVLARFRLDGQNTVARIWADRFRWWWPDSGDIARMLSNFGTGKISVMVDYLKWRSTVSFNRGRMRLAILENDLRF